MRQSKLGQNNPMFGKDKSPEFIEQAFRDKHGIHNPMFGKKNILKKL